MYVKKYLESSMSVSMHVVSFLPENRMKTLITTLKWRQ